MIDEDVVTLSKAAGLSPDWIDAMGEHKRVPVETLRVVLKALGYSADNEGDIAESRRLLAERASQPPSLLIKRAGETIPLGRVRSATLHRKDGSRFATKLSIGADGNATARAPAEAGYYRLETDRGAQALVIAPSRCFSIADIRPRQRLSGLAAQLYALRGGHTAGFGDFAALAELIEAAAPEGIDAIAISPAHARLSSAISPYSPSTRFFMDPLYADVALAGGSPATDTNDRSLIDWSNAAQEKRRLLRETYARISASPLRDFPAFLAEGGERLASHAIFETLDAHFREQNIFGWPDWPAAFQVASSAAVKTFAREHSDDVRFHMFLQWLTAKSLASVQTRACDAGMAIGIIADLAVGMDPYGSHAWHAPEELLLGLTIGAPPDVFNRQGQNWGLTALSPTAMTQNGYAAFVDTLRANMRHAGAIRIDHAMGLTRLWLVPKGSEPGDGVYLNYPFDDLLALTALESQRFRAIVIGEDLGTVPEGFRDKLFRAGIMGMEVMWFQRDDAGYFDPKDWSRHAVAMTTTHDLPTVAGWWRGRDIDWLEKLGRESRYGDVAAEKAGRDRDRATLWSAFERTGSTSVQQPAPDDAEPVVAAALEFVGRTPGALAIVPLEDILATPEQPNIPGTIDEHPNWRRRLPPKDTIDRAAAKSNLANLRRARSLT